jgi:3-oxoacyl-[acyl-carrier protein] reductase
VSAGRITVLTTEGGGPEQSNGRIVVAEPGTAIAAQSAGVGARRLDGRVVALTGAGSGLGLLIAQALLEQGAQVIANYRSSADRLEGLREQHPDALHPLAGDVGDDDTAAAIAAAARSLGRLDVLIHNAAITRDRPLVAMTADEWDDVMRVNLRGAFLLTKQALRLMMKRRYGRLIYVSSVAAVMGNAGQANYAASKAGLHGLSRTVAQEYSSRGIRSVVVAPGLLDTGLGSKLPADVHRRKTERQLLGLGDAASVAATIAFLAGPEADYVNADVVRTDGGIVY